MICPKCKKEFFCYVEDGKDYCWCMSEDTQKEKSSMYDKIGEQFSLRTGKSVTEFINASQKFATFGFDFETSLEECLCKECLNKGK